MSTTPKSMRSQHGYYNLSEQPKSPVGGLKWDDPERSIEGMDRWYCRRHCAPTCAAGRDYRRISAMHRAYRHKTRNRW